MYFFGQTCQNLKGCYLYTVHVSAPMCVSFPTAKQSFNHCDTVSLLEQDIVSGLEITELETLDWKNIFKS